MVDGIFSAWGRLGIRFSTCTQLMIDRGKVAEMIVPTVLLEH